MALSGRYSVAIIYGAFSTALALLPHWAFFMGVFLISLFITLELSRALNLNGVYSAFFGFLAEAFFNLGLGAVIAVSFLQGLIRWSQDAFLKAQAIGLICGILPVYVLKIKQEFGAMALIKFFIFVWSVDTVSYLSGKAFGKRKIFGKLSPNKTLEGLIGGIIAGVLVLFILEGTRFTLKWGLSLVLASIIGDLVMSFVKRQAGIKDFSKALGEHGGLLDRLDALIFTAPFYFKALRGF
ncbi:MAG: phosphatidate cytidylyltransferase [Aquificaceae bacterium]